MILASASPRRKELLEQIGLIGFRIITSPCDESEISGATPAETAKRLALTKASLIAAAEPAALVIGADTIVVLGDEILGKPADPEEAKAMLRRLSGREHTVITGYCLLQRNRGRTENDYVSTRVFFRSLEESEIESYVATGEPLDKAGAYGIQGRGALFVERIEGCYSNVVGLPLAKIGQALRRFGIEVWPGR